MNRRLMFGIPLAVAAAGGAGFYAMLTRMGSGEFNPRGVPSALLGKPAPATSLPALLGHPGWTDAELRAGGTPLVVNFFASWCVPCAVEHPQFMALSRQGVRLLGVAYKDKPADAARFLARLGNPFAAVVQDWDGRAALEWGLFGVPETYVLDREARIRWRWAGAVTEQVMADELVPLLRQLA